MAKNKKQAKRSEQLENLTDAIEVSNAETEIETNDAKMASVETEKEVKGKKNNAVKQTSKSDKKQKEKKPKSNKVKEMVGELKKVTWPTFGTVVKKTAVVIVVCAFFLVILFGIDRLLSFLFELLTKTMA